MEYIVDMLRRDGFVGVGALTAKAPLFAECGAEI